jgi:hypothetical protein
MPNLGVIASSTRQGQVVPDTGAMFPLGMVSVGSAGAADVTFSSIPSTYTHLQIRAIARSTTSTTSEQCYIQFNTDTGSNYSLHYIYGDGTTAYSGGGSSQAQMYALRMTGATASSSIFGTGVVDILDYKNTNKYKTLRTLSGEDRNGNGFLFYQSGLWQSTSAITSIKLYPSANNFAQYSSFALYGIKGA